MPQGFVQVHFRPVRPHKLSRPLSDVGRVHPVFSLNNHFNIISKLNCLLGFTISLVWIFVEEFFHFVLRLHSDQHHSVLNAEFLRIVPVGLKFTNILDSISEKTNLVWQGSSDFSEIWWKYCPHIGYSSM